MILFTADWHIKLGQKNVPTAWACARYQMFYEQVQEAVDNHGVDLHIIWSWRNECCNWHD